MRSDSSVQEALSTSTALVEGSDDAHNLTSGMQKVFQARGISEKIKIVNFRRFTKCEGCCGATALFYAYAKPCWKDVIRDLDGVCHTKCKVENNIIVGYGTFVIKENKLCSGLIYLNGVICNIFKAG